MELKEARKNAKMKTDPASAIVAGIQKHMRQAP